MRLQLPAYLRLSLPWSLSLFWRSFGLLIMLIFIGFALWARGMQLRQEYPRAQALAGQLAIAVNLTRSALMHTKPANRTPLLLELNHNERVDVFIREAADSSIPLENTGLNLWLRTLLEDRLGKDTLLASEVNGISGLWISFDMEGNTLGLNTYWLRVDAERMEAHIQNDSL
jgi:two-component system osmolarity sensor histidine kinase EnvZ